MNLNALEDFRLVASHGGLGKASRASGRSKATLSRRIADLEEDLGIRLLERGTNQLRVTEAGQLLLARTEDPMRDVGEAVTAAREGVAMPRGRLRIAAPLLFSQLAFGQIASGFLAAYPQVQLEVVSEDRTVDPVEEHFDVVIRANPREDSALVGRCFARDRLVVAAAPSIKRPRPGKNQRLVRVPAVMLSSYGNGPWPIDGRRLLIEPRGVMTASSLLVVRDAVLAGLGVGLLPLSIIQSRLEGGDLVQWGTTGAPVELWVLHTSRRLPSPKVRAFVGFMSALYPDGTLVLPG